MDQDVEEFARFEDLHDPTTRVEEMLRRAVAEPFGRQIKAIERKLGVDDGHRLIRINLAPNRALLPGQAALVVVEMFPGLDLGDPPPVEAYVVFGTKNLHTEGSAGCDPTYGQVASLNLLPVRLAIAHELGHLALSHCFVGDRLQVPDEGFTRAQDWEASAYAVHTTRLTGRFIAKHRALLVPYWKSIQDWVSQNWKRYGHHPVRARFERRMASLPDPWPEMAPDEINDFRLGGSRN